jgi:general secretion pathway protein D
MTNVKTSLLTLSALLLTASALWAQVPGVPPALPRQPGAPGAAPAAGGTVVPPIPRHSSSSPLPAPKPGGIVNAVPDAGATNVSPGSLPPIVPAPGTKNVPPEETIAAGIIDFRGAPLEQVLTVYANYVNRTILRPAVLPAPSIYLTTQTALTKRELIEALDAVLGMNGIGVINVGDKFAKAVPLQQVPQEGQAFNTNDVSRFPDLGPYITHVVQLRYAKPSELLPALTPLAKTPGNTFAIDSSQMLVIRDFTENVKRMLEVIKEIDVAVPSEFDQKVIPIRYALATDIASALNSLSSGGGGATSVGHSTSSSRGTSSSFGRSNTGGGMGGMGGGGYPGSSYGGQPGGYSPQAASPQASSGSTFGNRLQQIINKASSSGEIQVIGQTKIIADERTNSLLIFASREDMHTIEDIISKLDVVLAQVLIEAYIISYELGPSSKNFGVSYLQRPITSGQFTGAGTAGAGNFFSPGDFTGGGGTNGSGGIGALTGGFNYLAQWGQDLDVTLTAIASDSHSKILQRPRIQTSHAEQATIFVGQSRPYPTSSYYGGGAYGSYSSIQQLQIGVTLDVKPLVNPEGLVVMDIHQTIEDFAGNVTITGVGDVPITTRKEAQAKVAVRDHDTIILGGLIDDRKSDNNSGIPFLKDIPGLGYLFRSSSASSDRSELLVLIRPTVLPNPEVAALAAKAEKDKMPGIRRAEKEFQEEETRNLKADQKAEQKSHSK